VGGCGKSQLALEYCQRSRDSKIFSTILWIDATSPDTLHQSFTNIAKNMKKPEFNPANHEDNFRFVQNRVDAQLQSWLLIFDNFDDPKSFHKNIKEYFPQVGPGSILITTRHLDTTSLGRNLEVTRMSLEEGIKLLLSRSQVLRDERSVKEATSIVTRLGFHALAIDQAGSYISKRHLDIVSYLTHFKNRREKVLSEHPDIWDYRRPPQDDSDKETELTVFTTWELSFQLISGDELERKDKEYILTLMAFFNINGLSGQLFVPHAHYEKDWMVSCRNNGDWDTYAFQDILTELRNLSLLQSLEIQESALFSLHPLIQDWIKARISSEKRKLFSVESTIVLQDSINSQDLGTISFQAKQVLQSHLDAVLSNKDEYIPTEDFLASRDLLSAASTFATFLRKQGWFKRAEEIGRTVVEGRMKLFGDAGPETLLAKSDLSSYLLEQGKYAEAEPLCHEALAMQVKVLGKENEEPLKSMSRLTRILRGQGKYKAAEVQCRETLALQENVLGKENSDTLISMDTLAELLRDQKKYGEAEPIYREALAISETVLGKEHRDTLARILCSQQQKTNQGRAMKMLRSFW
jgi:tetratricopeptide (TPR) repeat protein